VGAAEWSLGSNAMQNEDVYKIIKSEMSLSSGTLKEELEKIIKSVNK
jgi:hypothetical protein